MNFTAIEPMNDPVQARDLMQSLQEFLFMASKKIVQQRKMSGPLVGLNGLPKNTIKTFIRNASPIGKRSGFVP